jgi:hypothetical protein
VIKLHEVKRTFVGRFAEEMLREIIGGELTRDEFGDLCIWDRERAVEIKSSSVPSSYGFRLSVEQINNGRRVRNFPFQSVWYALFAYSNPNKVGEEGYSDLSGKIEAEFRLDLFDEYKISVPLTAIILSDEARLFERDMRERGWDFKRRGL